jgi:hypothetical protein
LGITEQWESLAEARQAIESQLKDQGDEWSLIPTGGTPMDGIMLEFDVHDPPTETNILLIDAERYEAQMGWPAEDSIKFQIAHGRFLEALTFEITQGAEIAERVGLKILRPELRMDWLTDWLEIERRIRGHRVMKALTTDGDRAVPIRAWDVLVGVSGEARPAIICEGIKSAMRGATSTMIDNDQPWLVPWAVIHLPWKLLKDAVDSGRRVLIGESLR